jgi:hypothetical protein
VAFDPGRESCEEEEEEEEEEEQQQQQEHQVEEEAPMQSPKWRPNAFGSPTSRSRTAPSPAGRSPPRRDASPKKKKPRSSKKSQFHGAIESAINIPAGPLVTTDEIFILTKCFGKVHGKCPVAEEVDTIAQLYNEFYAANMFRGQPEFTHLCAPAQGA